MQLDKLLNELDEIDDGINKLMNLDSGNTEK